MLTTDYLNVTDPDALARLLDLVDTPGNLLTVRLFHDAGRSFHPKSYMFWSTREPVATGFVGSSNLSASGIDGGVEWNLGVDSVDAMRTAFERIWDDRRAIPLTRDWLREYRRRPIECSDLRILIGRGWPRLNAWNRPVQSPRGISILTGDNEYSSALVRKAELPGIQRAPRDARKPEALERAEHLQECVTVFQRQEVRHVFADDG